MPPKRNNSYVGVMDPVEKQYVKMDEGGSKKCPCTRCRRCIFTTVCLGVIGGSVTIGYLYYNNQLDFDL